MAKSGPRGFSEFQSGSVFRLDLKHGIEFGNLEKLAYFLARPDEFHMSILVPNRRPDANELAETKAVNVIKFGHIQNELSVSLTQKRCDLLT